jgi:apolipoprotein N-acyltransferase
MIEPTSLPTDRELAQRSATVSSEPLFGFDRPFARISWGSVFAGAMIALATQLVLTLIGAAIGLATLGPATGQSPSGTALGLGAAIWLVITSLVSLFLGGYVSARLGGTFNGWLHGLTTWGTVIMMTMLLLTTAAGGLIGTASGLANFAVSNSDKTSEVSLPPAIQQQIDQFSARASQSADEAARQAQQTTPEQQAADARQIGQSAAKGGAAGSGAAALGLILGALAAAFGGKTGQRYPIRESYDINSRTTRAPSERS